MSVDFQPLADFTISPDTGNTTTIFQFDASNSLETSLENNPVLLRWDWNADGIWDKMYTSGGNYTHRFFKKGTYTVLMEASTLLGRKDTTTITLVINQGYSKPHSKISISPDSANIFTEFVFDASESKDDEDSLNQLKFRWDFEGDDVWDTDFTSNPIVKHLYSENQNYQVKLEVKDPQEMTDSIFFDLIVTRLNDQIVPLMNMECWPCTLEDTIHFDASESFVKNDPEGEVLYSIDVFNDNVWEFTDSKSPFFKYRIPRDGIHKVKLRVSDEQGLYMDSIYTIEVFPYNTPPKVFLVMGNRYGNTSTNFYVHGRGSWDRESSYLDLITRWDLNDDGLWDEEFNDKFEAWVNFDKPGHYPIAFSITDTQDKSTIAYDTISVFSGNRQTDLLEDKRDGWIPEYYGTVLIGDTWWTQNNARYAPPQEFPLPPDAYYVYSYKEQIDSVFKYGYLYPYRAIKNKKWCACPDGWRIPSLADWENLMEELAPQNNIGNLLYGGSSELHMFLTGHKDLNGYSNKNRMVHYYTTDVNPSGHVFLWYIDKLLNKNKSVMTGSYYNLPVRCVKDN